MAQDLTIDIGINTISAIASLQNLGNIADRVFEKKHKLSFDDSSIKEFSNNLQNEFAKAVKSLDFSASFVSAQKSITTLKTSVSGVGVGLVSSFENVNVQLVKAQFSANALTKELTNAEQATENVADAAKNLNPFEKFNAILGCAMLGINAVKGFEIGSGFNSTNYFGSELNDEFINQK